MAYSQAMGWLRCRLSFALLRSSILCLQGARARVNQNFLLQPAVALAEGGTCCRHRIDQDQPSSYSFFYIQTCTHSGLYPTHFVVYARTRTPAHMHAHTFPCLVDSSANLLLLFMSLFCCYFSVFSSVCIKDWIWRISKVDHPDVPLLFGHVLSLWWTGTGKWFTVL